MLVKEASDVLWLSKACHGPVSVSLKIIPAKWSNEGNSATDTDSGPYVVFSLDDIKKFWSEDRKLKISVVLKFIKRLDSHGIAPVSSNPEEYE